MIKKHIFQTLLKFRGIYSEDQYDEINSIKTKLDLARFKKKYLSALLLHAYKNVNYYKTIFDDIGLIHNGNVLLYKFEDIPILTKDDIRNNYKNMITRDIDNRKHYVNMSGGSTGEPLQFIQDEAYRRWGNAVNNYWYKQFLNVDIHKVKKIILWGSERDIFTGSIGIRAELKNWLMNTKILNSFKMNENDMKEYIWIIENYKPYIIRGYAGSLFELCSYARSNNLKLYSPNKIVSSAEVLTEEMRSLIEESFNAKTYDFYGSRETANLAGECENSLLHILEFYNIIEVLDDNNDAVDFNEEGNVVVTNLHNYSMPLIRYKIEDTAILGPTSCVCGSILPTLKKITGRVLSHFHTNQGALISGGYFIILLWDKKWIKKFQVIQMDYNLIKILIVKRDVKEDIDIESNIEDIEEKIKLVMGNDCIIEWFFVSKIDKSPQGKHLQTISLLDNVRTCAR